MRDFTIKLEENPSPDDLKTIGRGLGEFNNQNCGSDNYQQFAVFVRDQQNEVVGGVYGEIVWDWLEIKIVWIKSDLRHLKFGSKLVQAAEQAAIDKGCRAAMLDTFSFQALGFYQKLGYTIFGKLDNFPGNHTRYFLRKALVNNESN